MNGIMKRKSLTNKPKKIKIMTTEEAVKSMLSKLDTMLEFDEGIDVDSVEELKNKFDIYVKENFQEAQTETTILKD